jgi:His-Xaa-Ser system radical SAM maturase HxsC
LGAELSGSVIRLATVGRACGIRDNVMGRVTLVPLSPAFRRDSVRVVQESPIKDESYDGYAAVIAKESVPGAARSVSGCDIGHLADGDVVQIDARGQVRTLYRRSSKSNSLFATERCNSFCLMCSQPPREVDDSGKITELLQLVRLIDPATEELGITGGEPTLLGDGLLAVVAECRDRLPRTALHILSNGRSFANASYARALGAVEHPDLMVGVPVYSDLDTHHDFVVQATGAFDETLLGLQNLAKAAVAVEIRVVIHRHTYVRLRRLAEFIYRNLTFARHVTFMGLEVIGFGKANVDSLWVDPADYATHLEEAVLFLSDAGMTVSVYNHQLCTLPASIREFSRQSISDWKNEFAKECADCAVKGACCGFFSWNIGRWQSRLIAPVVH